ncbi:MAG: SDR family NAD(P)-dependent oxidoreductase [Anaerolineaceae bacterium]|nr:SDR family NAD(P)-dependent oxidoreductase [Anaerolineaceae bacterium]
MNTILPKNALDQSVVLITGAGRGLGRALAVAFAAQGAWVAANDLTPINLDKTVEIIQSRGSGTVRSYLADISKDLPVHALIEQIIEDWGRIDILINNAGVRPHSSLLDMDGWDWQRTLDVNLSGPFFLMQAVGQSMRERRQGVIINIAAADTPALMANGWGAFFASKMGLVGLSRAAAAELMAYNIRVNTICPVEFRLIPPEIDPQAAGEPNPPLIDTILNLALFLCSPAASALTGQVYTIDDSPIIHKEGQE